MGGGCDTKHYVPDVYLMSIILFLGTFLISVVLKDFKNSLFFPAKVRIIIILLLQYNRPLVQYSGIRENGPGPLRSFSLP